MGLMWASGNQSINDGMAKICMAQDPLSFYPIICLNCFREIYTIPASQSTSVVL